MMRLAVLCAAFLALPSPALAQSYSGSMRSTFGCPSSPRCADEINVRVSPGDLTHRRGAIFAGFFPLSDGAPSLPGAFISPSGELVISAQPVAYHTGRLGTANISLTVKGGVCAEAERQGISGDFALIAGLGLADDALASLLDQRGTATARAQTEEERRKIERSFEILMESDPIGVSSAKDMINNNRYSIIKKISCPVGR
ncbi:MAG: hypothetical protein DDT25_00062 [Chloroflexi bacterium]|nr:hypothetical protein [Chloroflexota bacterium]